MIGPWLSTGVRIRKVVILLPIWSGGRLDDGETPDKIKDYSTFEIYQSRNFIISVLFVLKLYRTSKYNDNSRPLEREKSHVSPSTNKLKLEEIRDDQLRDKVQTDRIASFKFPPYFTELFMQSLA